jgi:hypothetical protein
MTAMFSKPSCIERIPVYRFGYNGDVGAGQLGVFSLQADSLYRCYMSQQTVGCPKIEFEFEDEHD